MDRSGSYAVMTANNVEHVRLVVVFDHRTIGEE